MSGQALFHSFKQKFHEHFLTWGLLLLWFITAEILVAMMLALSHD